MSKVKAGSKSTRDLPCNVEDRFNFVLEFHRSRDMGYSKPEEVTVDQVQAKPFEL